MKQFTVAIIGTGSRGSRFANYMNEKREKFLITALCDINSEQIRKTLELTPMDKVETFTDPKVFFEKKRADILVIATPDREHVPQAVQGMNLGYDLLLEKPLSDSLEELDLLLKTQQKTKKRVVVCHELRYAPGFRKCADLLKEGVIGKVYAIDASERVWYAHWAQAYVRGIGASIELGHPAILAKCSHDLDLIQAYANSECDTVSSVGDLSFFVPENAPEDSAYRCLDCKYQNECPYSAKRIYLDYWYKLGKPEFQWPFNKVTIEKPHTEEKIRHGLREGEYGICAFKCKVEKVDHQFVQMTFRNGIKASLKMVYASEAGRRLVFYGNYGEMVFDEREDRIDIMPYGEEKRSLSLKDIMTEDQSHGGGDIKLVEQLYGMLTGEKECLTTLKESVESHLMGIAAEESRKAGGQLVKVHR